MIQQPFTTPDIAGDGMDTFLLADGTFRLSIVHGTEMVNRMQANHRLGPAGTLVLGHAYLIAVLSTHTLKNEERLGLSVECSGLVQGLSVEADARGNVRGYLKNNEIDVADVADLRKIWGEGTLSMLRYAETMRHPSQGQIHLRPGTLAENVAAYYAESEQIATFVDINIHFDDHGAVVGAGGIVIQSLPGAELSVLDKLADALTDIRPVGQRFSAGATAVQLVRNSLGPWNPRIIATRPAEFFCGCSKERFSRFLAALPQDEKDDILANGPLPLHTTCHNCNSTYKFSETELTGLFVPSASDH